MNEYSKYYYIDDMTIFDRREKDDMKQIMLKTDKQNIIPKHTTTVDLIDVSFLKFETNKKDDKLDIFIKLIMF